MSEWISVDDALPESRDLFLVYCQYRACKECDVAYLDGQDLWRETISEEYVPATHWMPLPEPPKA